MMTLAYNHLVGYTCSPLMGGWSSFITISTPVVIMLRDGVSERFVLQRPLVLSICHFNTKTKCLFCIAICSCRSPHAAGLIIV